MNARDALLQLVDQSNWPEMNGTELIGYREAMEAVHETIMDFWPELTAKQLPEDTDDNTTPAE